MTDTFLRVWKPDRRGTEKHAGRTGIGRVEVVRDGVVVATIPGLRFVQIEDPLDDVSALTLTTLYFELKLEPEKPTEAWSHPFGVAG